MSGTATLESRLTDGTVGGSAPPGDGRTSRRRWLVAAVLVVIMAVVGVAVTPLLPGSADGPPSVGVTDVQIVDGAFDPPVIQVEEGTTVTWTFADGQTQHNVVGEGWGRETAQSTGTHEHTFAEAGTYPYACTLHFGMDGRVDVVVAGGGR